MAGESSSHLYFLECSPYQALNITVSCKNWGSPLVSGKNVKFMQTTITFSGLLSAHEQ